MPTKIEDKQRVFPVSDSAESVWNVLVRNLQANKVTVETKATVRTILHEGEKITGVLLGDGTVQRAASYILATGGKSKPETGSTGDGFRWLTDLGHRVLEPDASLVPLTTKETWAHQLAGVTLEEVKISVYQNDIKQLSKKGRLLFTHVGVTGPTILNMSKEIGELLKYGEVTLALDLFSGKDLGALDRALVQAFAEQSNKQFKNALSGLLPSALAKALVGLSNIPPLTPCHSIAREDRLQLGRLLKHLPLSVSGLLGVDKAIVTSGGVALEEIDFKTMRSRKYENLYVIGDLLNIDRPSGGYSLQLCWTTGFVAGNAVPIIGK